MGEGLDSLCNYTVRCCCFFFVVFFSIFSAVLQRCHNRGWTSPSPLYLLSEQLTMEHSAGGDPDRLIVLWQPWPSQLEDRKQQNTACLPGCSPPPLPHASSKLQPPIHRQYTSLNTPSSPLFTVTPATKDIFFFSHRQRHLNITPVLFDS